MEMIRYRIHVWLVTFGPPLGSRRNDHRILDHLRVDESENLGAEIIPAVTVADPSARDFRPPEVNPLHARGSHPHFVE